jgi:hypothetical protein
MMCSAAASFASLKDRSRRIFGGFVATYFLATPLAAQSLRGEVRDSANGQPVGGAIVMVLDSAGRTLVRNLTTETGQYVVRLPPTAQRLRVVRLGFRPREMALAGLANTAALNVALSPIPTFLQAVSVTAASGCPARSDRQRALALYEQARTGLLATIVAREANPARMVMYNFVRTMDGRSDRVAHQSVSVDSSARSTVSFSAARSGVEFVRDGFVIESEQDRVFLGPDADVLLSDAFAAGYCFSLARASARTNQVGLAFEAASRKTGRVDITGALWIDTVARRVNDIEFQYVGLGRRLEVLEPGGRIEFREMPNGAVIMDRWKLRLIGMSADTVRMTGTEAKVQQSSVVVDYVVSETGGELVSARWRNGQSWRAPLSRVHVQATNSRGEPAVGAELGLDDSPYRGHTNSAGVLELVDVIPGKYSLVVRDKLLEPIGVTIPTSVSIVATRDSLHAVAVQVPTVSEFIHARCVRDKRGSPQDSTRLLVRVMTYMDDPVEGAAWKVNRTRGPFFDNGKTGSDGMFQICDRGLGHGTSLGIVASREGWNDAADQVTVNGLVTVVKLLMTPRQ